ASRPRRLHGDLQIFFHAILPDVIGKIRRADAGFDTRVFVQRFPGYDSISRVVHFLWVPIKSVLDVSCRAGRTEFTHARFSASRSCQESAVLLAAAFQYPHMV